MKFFRFFRKSFFDNMILFYLFILALCFAGMVYYSDFIVNHLLISERTSSLQSQARLIATQYAKSYFDKDTNNVQLEEQLTSLNSLLNIDIWIADVDGQLIAASPRSQSNGIEEKRELYQKLQEITSKIYLTESFAMTGNFYGLFEDNTLSVGIPMQYKDRQVGYIFLHSSLSDMSSIKSTIIQVLCLAYLLIMLFSLLILYHFTKKVLNPLDKINSVALDYSNGNFDSSLTVDDKYEIGQLADSLNNMAGELQKMEDYRKNFISNVSHDFRSPLTSIKGYLEAMQDGTIPPERQAHYIDVVLNETRRLTKLTSSLITLNDFNSSSLILKKSIFDLSHTIQLTIDSFEGIANKKKVQLLPDLPSDPVMVYADQDKIYQVLYNLIDNALKFSNENSSIFITVLPASEDKVHISVKDKGKGISEEQQKHIWERFYKADSSRGQDKHGSGLGLAIVKEIIKAHNETITLESKEGKGADFSFSLPLAPSQK